MQLVARCTSEHNLAKYSEVESNSWRHVYLPLIWTYISISSCDYLISVQAVLYTVWVNGYYNISPRLFQPLILNLKIALINKLLTFHNGEQVQQHPRTHRSAEDGSSEAGEILNVCLRMEICAHIRHITESFWCIIWYRERLRQSFPVVALFSCGAHKISFPEFRYVQTTRFGLRERARKAGEAREGGVIIYHHFPSVITLAAVVPHQSLILRRTCNDNKKSTFSA